MFRTGQSATHLASNIEGDHIALNTSSKTTVRGSHIKAKQDLTVIAQELDITAVNNSSYHESKVAKKGLMSSSETTHKQAISSNMASDLSANNILLNTQVGFNAPSDINIIGSNVSAQQIAIL